MKIIDDDGQVIAEGHAFTLNTGDCLVFQTRRQNVSQESLGRFAAQLGQLFPDNKTVILGPDEELSILRHPTEENATDAS